MHIWPWGGHLHDSLWLWFHDNWQMRLKSHCLDLLSCEPGHWGHPALILCAVHPIESQTKSDVSFWENKMCLLLLYLAHCPCLFALASVWSPFRWPVLFQLQTNRLSMVRIAQSRSCHEWLCNWHNHQKERQSRLSWNPLHVVIDVPTGMRLCGLDILGKQHDEFWEVLFHESWQTVWWQWMLRK